MTDPHRILEGYAWIKVKKYDPPVDATVEERLRLLEAHHLRETEFLIATCQELARELLDERCSGRGATTPRSTT